MTMALRIIAKQGEPILGKRCRPVTEFNDRLHTLLDDMRETLTASNGVGLAAPQVSILRRAVLVLETNVENPGEEYIIELINPEIIASEGEQDGSEGCLSIPGLYGYVTRPMKVTVRAQDRNGEWFEVTGEGLTARAFCHELDHLDGILFDSYVDRLMTEEELLIDMEEDDEE